MITESTCKEFVTALASKESVPGGGGAAALVGSIAAALTSMVCNLTTGKKAYENVEEKIQTILQKTQKLQDELLDLVELDAKVFGELMAVYKMPKNTDQEKAVRSALLQDRTKSAALAPMQVAKACVKVQQLALEALNDGNKDLSSDAILSGILGRAALRSAYYNVLINLQLIKDQEWNSKIYKELQELLAQGQDLENQIVAISDKIYKIDI